jgi:hypothetical protein
MYISKLSSIKVFEEEIANNLEGTVIDIETIGDFCKQFKGDSRECMNHKQIILGYICGPKLCIFCAINEQGIYELSNITNEILSTLQKPFFAFNCSFESSVWFHQIGFKINFEGELQKYKYEKKKDAILSVSIPNYDDPFFDIGLKCIEAWNCGNIRDAIAHNRACLLKEKDLLLKRGFWDSKEVVYID